MGNTKAIGRRGRVLRRANDRAQRRIHNAIDAGVVFDPFAKATQLWVEAEALVRRIADPEEDPSDLDKLALSLRMPHRDETDVLAMYWNRGA